jgi:hypothetical protein
MGHQHRASGTDTRLCLGTMNADAMIAGLKVCKLQPVINSTLAERARLETYLPMAKTYEAEIIGLAMTEAGVSRLGCDQVRAPSELSLSQTSPARDRIAASSLPEASRTRAVSLS